MGDDHVTTEVKVLFADGMTLSPKIEEVCLYEQQNGEPLNINEVPKLEKLAAQMAPQPSPELSAMGAWLEQGHEMEARCGPGSGYLADGVFTGMPALKFK